jgi:dolichol-phosphate mannosyltransferase
MTRGEIRNPKAEIRKKSEAGNQMKTCTVLPTYNERDNIEALIRGVLQHAVTPHVVLVVDDDSPDGTSQVVQKLVDQQADAGLGPAFTPQVRLLRRIGQRGLTSALQLGIDTAITELQAEVVTWMDCDLSMPPGDVARLVSAIVRDGADLAVGSRWIPGGADRGHDAEARLLSWLINRFAQALLGRQVHDYTSGFVAARAEVLQTIRLRGDYGEYCIDFLARSLQHGYRVQEVPYVCVPRATGQSKTGATLLDYLLKGRKYVSTVWQLSRKS